MLRKQPTVDAAVSARRISRNMRRPGQDPCGPKAIWTKLLNPRRTPVEELRSRRPDTSVSQEIATATRAATFFSTAGVHFTSANDTGHTSPSSRLAASWNSKVE